jgi:hypothetical protein
VEEVNTDKQTQGRRLIALLKRRSYTGLQLNMLAISVSWWRRVDESLKPGEVLLKVKGRDGLLRYSVRGANGKRH